MERVPSRLPILKATALMSPLRWERRCVKPTNLPFSQHLIHLRPIFKPLLPACRSKTHHVYLPSSSMPSKKLLLNLAGTVGTGPSHCRAGVGLRFGVGTMATCDSSLVGLGRSRWKTKSARQGLKASGKILIINYSQLIARSKELLEN